MDFVHINNYPSLLDVIIRQENLNHPHLSSVKVIENIIKIPYHSYCNLMRGWFPDFNNPAAKSIRLFLERNYARSITHKRSTILITDMPVLLSSSDKSHASRRASLTLKQLSKGNFDAAPLSHKSRNELNRWHS